MTVVLVEDSVHFQNLIRLIVKRELPDAELVAQRADQHRVRRLGEEPAGAGTGGCGGGGRGHSMNLPPAPGATTARM